MFGLTKKSRYKEFLRRAVKAVMEGGYLPPTKVEALSINEPAKRELASYADAILLYLLNAVFISYLGEKYSWANSLFVQQAIADICKEYDAAFSRRPGRTAGHVFSYINKIAEMTPDERGSGKQFQEAVESVIRVDSSINAENVRKTLRSAAEEFYADVERKLREAQ